MKWGILNKYSRNICLNTQLYKYAVRYKINSGYAQHMNNQKSYCSLKRVAFILYKCRYNFCSSESRDWEWVPGGKNSFQASSLNNLTFPNGKQRNGAEIMHRVEFNNKFSGRWNIEFDPRIWDQIFIIDWT